MMVLPGMVYNVTPRETVRVPRRPLAGANRKEVLRVIRAAIETRPAQAAGAGVAAR